MALRVRYEGSSLQLSEPLPTTTTEHHMLQKSQSYAPEDGQKIARNMLC